MGETLSHFNDDFMGSPVRSRISHFNPGLPSPLNLKIPVASLLTPRNLWLISSSLLNWWDQSMVNPNLPGMFSAGHNCAQAACHRMPGSRALGGQRPRPVFVAWCSAMYMFVAQIKYTSKMKSGSYCQMIRGKNKIVSGWNLVNIPCQIMIVFLF